MLTYMKIIICIALFYCSIYSSIYIKWIKISYISRLC